MTSPDTLGTGVTFAGAAESSTQLTGPLVATYSGHAAFVPIAQERTTLPMRLLSAAAKAARARRGRRGRRNIWIS